MDIQGFGENMAKTGMADATQIWGKTARFVVRHFSKTFKELLGVHMLAHWVVSNNSAMGTSGRGLK